MKGFFYKVKKKLANISQEAKIGLSIVLVAVFFFGGIGLTKKWWQPNPSTSTTITSDNVITNTNTATNSNLVANELDEIVGYPYPSNATIVTYYFDLEDDVDTQAKSVVVFEGKYYSSKGIDVTLNDTDFIVQASASGTVKSKTNDPIYGLTVTVEGANNTLFTYSSLSSSPLKEGDKIKKGNTIGYAGESAFGSSLKSKHLHFEVYHNNTHINPLSCFGKAIGDIKI